MMDTNGDVIMADDHVIARIDYNSNTQSYPANGTATRCTSMPGNGAPQQIQCSSANSITVGGASISPTLLANNTVVAVATSNPGYIYSFWADNLAPITSPALLVAGNCSVGSTACYYETVNTPAASYNSATRFYVSMNAYAPPGDTTDESGYGLLVAIDVDTSGSMASTSLFAFGGTSGASPAVLPITVNGSTASVIYFDGQEPSPPVNGGAPAGTTGYVFSVVDYGTYGALNPNWVNNGNNPANPVNLNGGTIPVSGSFDNLNERNCIWFFPLNLSSLQCLNLGTGHIDNTFSVRNISTLQLAVPTSSISLTQGPTGAVMILGVGPGPGGVPGPLPHGQVLGIKLAGDYSTQNFMATPYWGQTNGVNNIISLPNSGEYSFTQFPIMTDQARSQPVIVFPTNKDRAYFYEYVP
jgi:hypothetical protein